MNNYVTLKFFFIITLLIFPFSCKTNKIYEKRNYSVDPNINNKEKVFDTEKIDKTFISEDNEIEILSKDYNIIAYSETKLFYKNTMQIHLQIKIINNEKILQLNNLVNPVIYLEFNDNIYLAKGCFFISSNIPEDCDFSFAIDANKRIAFFKNHLIGFLGFREVDDIEN
jgi:hypothetical protein